MKNLNDAIEDLKEAILDEGFREDLVQEVAEEHGINSMLLERKFNEATNQSPERYKRNLDLPSGEDIRSDLEDEEEEKREYATSCLLNRLRDTGRTKTGYIRENGKRAWEDKIVELMKHPIVLKTFLERQQRMKRILRENPIQLELDPPDLTRK